MNTVVFYIIVQSSAFALWLTTLFLMLTIRLWQVRFEVMPAFKLHDLLRIRQIALLFGIFLFVGFATLQRIQATRFWLEGIWSFYRTDQSQVFTLPFGNIGVLLCLWWAFGMVLGQDSGNRIFKRFVVLGFASSFICGLIAIHGAP